VKLVGMTKMCLNETYSEVHTDKHSSDSFQSQNYLNQGDCLLPMLLNFSLDYAIRKAGETRWS
jgi:hypothetical protein